MAQRKSIKQLIAALAGQDGVAFGSAGAGTERNPGDRMQFCGTRTHAATGAAVTAERMRGVPNPCTNTRRNYHDDSHR